ncbi:hypothetical protein HanPSC8_Chr10g0421551 [Helianthus annuus]|nr:hypothetical protein HanPSC8_Chr10g0421551 [Helianthus annuus]
MLFVRCESSWLRSFRILLIPSIHLHHCIWQYRKLKGKGMTRRIV